jgi:hypothetical protein
MTRSMRAVVPAGMLAVVLGGCGMLGLGGVVEPPRFEQAPGRNAELVLHGPSQQRPLGSAGIRLWARVENPNAFGFTLAAVEGDLLVEDVRLAGLHFPLGVPLQARRDTIIPLEITVGLNEIPGLANLALRLVTGSAVPYRLDGTVAVEAGPLGQPRFGPSTWLTGTLDVRR